MNFAPKMSDDHILEVIPMADITLEGSKVLGGTIIDPWYAAYMMLLSMLFFHLCNRVAGYMDIPKAVVAANEQWRWKNICVSWIHALTAGLWSVLLMYYHPDMLEDLYTYKSASAFALSAFSTAYFFYDFIDIIFGIGFITHWEVCIHHIPVCIGMLYNVMSAGYIGYHAMVLSLEVNSVFLHIRKIMHMTQAYGPHSWQYRLNALLNLVTFAIFRFGTLVWIDYGLYTYWDAVPRGYWWFLLTATLMVFLINIVLFRRLVINDFLKKRPRNQSFIEDLYSNDSITGPIANGDVVVAAGDGKQTRPAKRRDNNNVAGAPPGGDSDATKKRV